MASNIAPLINDTHAKVERARKAVVEHAVECGRLLTEAKATVAHGKWQHWLTANCTFSARTAQLYMRAFKQLSDDPAKAQRVADFSLRQLDNYLAEGERDDKPSPDSVSAQVDAKIHDAAYRQWRDQWNALWYAGSPAARRRFAHELRDRGEIDDARLERWLQHPELQDYENA